MVRTLGMARAPPHRRDRRTCRGAIPPSRAGGIQQGDRPSGGRTTAAGAGPGGTGGLADARPVRSRRCSAGVDAWSGPAGRGVSQERAVTAAAGSPRRVSGVAWAAAAWAAVFGAGSVYLAVGGTTGLGLVAESIRDGVLRRESGMVAALWTYGALKLAVATVPLVATLLPAR